MPAPTTTTSTSSERSRMGNGGSGVSSHRGLAIGAAIADPPAAEVYDDLGTGRRAARIVSEGNRKADQELGAATFALAERAHGTAVQRDHFAHDGQADAEAERVAALVAALEGVEDPRQRRRRDANAVVADAKARSPVVLRQGDANLSAG